MDKLECPIEAGARPRPLTRVGQVNKLARLGRRLREAEWRRYGYLLMAGKALGIVALFGTMYLISNVIGSAVHAADAEPVMKGNDIVNPINTVWTLIAAFLVFGMQAGFTMLEAGFCRSRETVNVLMECVVDTCLCGLLFYAPRRSSAEFGDFRWPTGTTSARSPSCLP